MTAFASPCRSTGITLTCRPAYSRFLSLASLVLFFLAGGAQSEPGLDSRWNDLRPNGVGLAWVGCWEPWEQASDSAAGSVGQSQTICLEPGPSHQSLTRSWIEGGRLVSKQGLRIDGSVVPLSEGGCEGWERAQLSPDGRRLYFQAEADCGGGRIRQMSGAWLLVSREQWLEVQVVRVAGVLDVRAERFRAVGANTVRHASAIPLAVETARLAASAQLTVEDVLETLTQVDSAVVEAMLFETRPSFAMRSSLLIELADKGVPDPIIDLMVALSFPDSFVIVDNSIRPAPAAPMGTLYYYGYYDFFYSYSHHRFRYGYWRPHPPYHRPNRGRVISGLGYTRVHRSRHSPGGPASSVQGGAAEGKQSGGSNVGAVSASGHTSGRSGASSGRGSKSSTTKRKAVRRKDF